MGEGDPEQYLYVWGMPEWFFYSCIVGYPVITIFLWGIVRFFFKEVPLDEGVENCAEQKECSESQLKDVPHE